jgi:hypothetical protein
MLQRGQTWLSAKLTRFASQQVIYQRDDLFVELPATIGKSEYEQDDGEGVITRAQVRDFLINTKDLLGSVIGTWPRRGDRILETDVGWVNRDGRQYAAILDNNYPGRFELTPREQFVRLWAGYGGFALTVMDDPASSLP